MQFNGWLDIALEVLAVSRYHCVPPSLWGLCLNSVQPLDASVSGCSPTACLAALAHGHSSAEVVIEEGVQREMGGGICSFLRLETHFVSVQM